MSDSVEAFASYFDRADPHEVIDFIRVPQDGDEDSQEDYRMREGLYLAVRRRPYIALTLCPTLATSDSPRFVLLFLELAYDLWRVDPCMLLTLLMQLCERADEETRQRMKRELDAYKRTGESFESSDFEYFLLAHGF